MNAEKHIAFAKKLFVTGKIITLTGLHIGGSSTEISIGGVDRIVVRDPLTNHPYIPGSSLRGKMRSLLERARGEMDLELELPSENKNKKITVKSIGELGKHLIEGAKLLEAKPCSDPNSKVALLFGVAVDKQEKGLEGVFQQRLIVRDARLLNPEELEEASNTDMPMTEVKTEVAIDRITSKANPRQIERVPAGAEFGFEFVLNLYEGDDQNEYLNLLFEAMELLQDDYLGGYGSRGYGKVKFQVESITCKTAEAYKKHEGATQVQVEIPEIFQVKQEAKGA